MMFFAGWFAGVVSCVVAVLLVVVYCADGEVTEPGMLPVNEHGPSRFLRGRDGRQAPDVREVDSMTIPQRWRMSSTGLDPHPEGEWVRFRQASDLQGADSMNTHDSEWRAVVEKFFDRVWELLNPKGNPDEEDWKDWEEPAQVFAAIDRALSDGRLTLIDKEIHHIDRRSA